MTDIVVIGGGIGAWHCVHELLEASKKQKGLKITAVLGNPFYEFNLAAGVFLTDPEAHSKYVSADPAFFQQKGVNYIFEPAKKIDPERKTVSFEHHSPLAYKACVIATGSKMPLVITTPGFTFQERHKEVKDVYAAIKQQGAVVLNGAGMVGVEMAGDIRARNPEKTIYLISRAGKVLSNSHPPERQDEVMKVLSDKRIEVIHGEVPEEFDQPRLEAGEISIKLKQGGEKKIAFCLFMPCFYQRPNTQMLDDTQGVLNEKKQLIVNNTLQSVKHPELFGVGVSTEVIVKHPVSMRTVAQAKTCARNAACLVEGKKTKPHEDKEGMMMDKPMNIKIGHGAGGYLLWESGSPFDIMCCLCIKAGFPFCPPPCCWCCMPGCACAFGTCCKENGGEPAARCLLGGMLPMLMGSHGFKGVGKIKDVPVQKKME